jgi:hypothetical protein
MSTGESLDAHVSVESSTNGNIVKERPLPDQGTLHLMGRPRVGRAGPRRPFLGQTILHGVSAADG